MAGVTARRIERAAAKYEELPTGFTTGAHPVGCAIAMASLDEIIDALITEHQASQLAEMQEQGHA